MEFVDYIKTKSRMTNHCSIDCKVCPLYFEHRLYDNKNCRSLEIYHPEEAEKVVEKWGKEHPFVSNADKFKEVFGMELSADTHSNSIFIQHMHRRYEEWLKEEYKEPKNG